MDSSDAAFQTAGALALREAAADARIHLLEPVAEVTVLVGDDYVGAVMSDLSGRRGRVVGTEQAGGGRTLVRAEVPEIEIGRYAVDLRSLSHGTARFSRSYARHEPMPPQIAERIREQAQGRLVVRAPHRLVRLRRILLRVGGRLRPSADECRSRRIL